MPETTAATSTTTPTPVVSFDDSDIGEQFLQHIERIGKPDPATAAQPAPEAKGATAAGAPPVAVAPAASPEDWWDHGLDVDHAMLKGRTGEDVVTMFRHARDKIREQGTRLNEVNRRQQEVAPAPLPVAPAAPVADPRIDEYEAVIYTNPTRAREIMQQWADERYDKKRSDEKFEEERTGRYNSAATAGTQAVTTLATETGADQATIMRRLAGPVAHELRGFADRVFEDFGGNSGDPAQVQTATAKWYEVWADPENYAAAYRELYGVAAPAAATAVAVPIVTARADPPGGKSAAPPSGPKPSVPRSLSNDLDRALSQMGDGILSPQESTLFKQRVASRRA